MNTSVVRLWQLISPTLPVGGFSYSQGLEYAVFSGDVSDAPSAAEWIGGLLEQSVAVTDLPLLLRVREAYEGGDDAAVREWSRRLAAMRETAELRFEDLAMGEALARLLRRLGVRVPDAELPFPAAFGVAAAAWKIPAADACAGYAWAWAELQVAAAVKLVPLGHTDGQRLLLELGERLEDAVARAEDCADDDLGASLPGFAIASARHETQYTRLFRS